MKKKELNFLDCTFRDGGYYNNWDFSPQLIQIYLNQISQTSIKYVEIGFFTLKKKNTFGLTSNIDKKFFNKIKIPENLNIGLMINASELISKNQKNSEKMTRLKDIDYKNIKFIRIACHLSEYSKILKYIIFFKKKKIKLFLNIMQISEIKNSDIKKICSYVSKKVDIIYLADSLGSLNSNSTIRIVKAFARYTSLPLGIHAHDNLGGALENSKIAFNSGCSWVDGTMQGMGRGPGNLKTEKFYYHKNKFNKDSLILKKISKSFTKRKNKFKWGTNKYYFFSGKNKIHPSYVQNMLSDKRINKKNIINILKNIKKENAKKFDPNNLYINAIFYKKIKDNKTPNTKKIFFAKKDVFVLSSKYKSTDISSNTESILKDRKKTKILINISNDRQINKHADILAICHPMRLLSYNTSQFKSFKKILIPYNNLLPNFRKKFKEKFIINYGIKFKKNTIINRNYVQFDSPLALIYVICFLISQKVNSIYLLGFGGFKKNESFHDDTLILLKEIIKKYRPNIFSLTKNNLNIKFIRKYK